MKSLLTSMAILLCINVFANTIFVDPSVTTGSVANTFPSLTSAIAASSNGDTIFIAAGSYASASPIIIDKSLTIAPQDSSEIIDFYGSGGANNIDMNVNGSAGMIVKLFNLKFNTLSLNGAANMSIQLSNLNVNSIPLAGASDMNLIMNHVVCGSGITLNGAANMNVQLSQSSFQGNMGITGYNGMHIILNTITCNGSITLSGAENMKMQLNNVNCTGSMTANASAGSNGSRTAIYMIDCNINSELNIDQDNYELEAIHCNVGSNTTFRYGSFVASKTNNLFVNSEPGGGNVADSIHKILIVADTISEIIGYNNDNFKFVISNNLLKCLNIGKWNHYQGNVNLILNNEFISSSSPYNPSISFPKDNVPKYNFDVSNNIFNSPQFIFQVGNGYSLYIWGWENYNLGYPYSSSSCGYYQSGCPFLQGGALVYGSAGMFNCNSNSCWGYHNYLYSYGTPNLTTNATLCQFPNRDAPGTFKWTYNGFSIPGVGSIPGNLTFVNVAGSQNTVNAGNPGAEYTDIDLTRNDRGRLGGPYSILNYNPTSNPSNGKAFIFDLDIPTTLQATSQPVNIRAKGYHRN